MTFCCSNIVTLNTRFFTLTFFSSEDSLKSLIGALTACYPQFVRCIKPNQSLVPVEFHTSMVSR